MLLEKNPNAYIVGSIGNISKDLSVIPHDHKILVKGAMGSVMGIGLGIALNTNRRVIVLIGDGSFLMKMGSISTILKHNLKNLKVVIINNNCYQSCGGQETNFESIRSLLPESIKVYEIYPAASADQPNFGTRRKY